MAWLMSDFFLLELMFGSFYKFFIVTYPQIFFYIYEYKRIYFRHCTNYLYKLAMKASR